MAAELATIDWKEMDIRDPANQDEEPWVDILDLEEEIKMDDVDEIDLIDRRHSIVSRQKRKKLSLQT